MAFIAVLPLAAFAGIKLKKRIEETIFPSIVCFVLIAYILGLVSDFSILMPVYLTLMAVMLALSIYYCVKDKSNLHLIFTSGLAAYILFAAYYALVDKGRDITFWDELTAWGSSAKFYYYLNDFPPLDTPALMNGGYYPGAPLWYFISTRFWITFSDSIMLLGEAVLVYSMIIPVYRRISLRRNKGRFVLVTGILAIVPLLCNGTVVHLTTLYVDIMLGTMFAYVLWQMRQFIFSYDPFYGVTAVIGLFYLALVKNTGLVLAALSVILFILELRAAYGDCGWREGKNVRKDAGLVAGMIVSPLTACLSWEIYLYVQTGDHSISRIMMAPELLFPGVILAGVIIALLMVLVRKGKVRAIQSVQAFLSVAGIAAATLLCAYPEERYDILDSFISILFTQDRYREIGYSVVGFGANLIIIPFVLYVVILFTVWRVLQLSLYRGNASCWEVDNTAVNSLAVSFITYALVCYMVYTLGIRGEGEALSNAELGRYLHTYVLGMTIYICYLLVSNAALLDEGLRYSVTEEQKDDWREQKKRDRNGIFSVRHQDIALTLILCASVALGDSGALVTQLYHKTTRTDFSGITSYTPEAVDKILFIDQDEENRGRDSSYFYYDVLPAYSRGTGLERSDLSGSEDYSTDSSDSAADGAVSAAELSDYLADGEYDYVYLYSVNKTLMKKYRDLFADSSHIDEGVLYEISADHGEIELTAVH